MQHTRHDADQRTPVRVAVAPATSVEVALLFSALLGLLFVLLL